MGRAVKPAKKPVAEKVAGEYSLNATEAYQLNAAQAGYQQAQRSFDRAASVLNSLAAEVLTRHGVEEDDLSAFRFDVLETGVFLVRRES